MLGMQTRTIQVRGHSGDGRWSLRPRPEGFYEGRSLSAMSGAVVYSGYNQNQDGAVLGWLLSLIIPSKARLFSHRIHQKNRGETYSESQ